MVGGSCSDNPIGCYQLLQSQQPCPRAVVLTLGRWQTWTGDLSLHCHSQAFYAALHQGIASSCEAAPHQLISASPNPGLSQPPAGLALGCPLVCRPHMAPAFSPHLPLSAHECELPSHLPGSSDETPARTRGTCTVHRWVASSRPRKMLRVPGPQTSAAGSMELCPSLTQPGPTPPWVSAHSRSRWAMPSCVSSHWLYSWSASLSTWPWLRQWVPGSS